MKRPHGKRDQGTASAVLCIFLLLVTPVHAFDNWLSLRDAGVVRQERDFSCGAAALATVLSYFYREPVSEQALLQQLLTEQLERVNVEGPQEILSGEQALSFSDLAMLARSRGYPVMGVEVPFEDLAKLTLPVIVALTVQGRGHFTVLRRIDSNDRVFLADPSWGNRQLGKGEFLQSFARRDEESRGRILIIGSRDDMQGDDSFRYRPSRRVLMAPGV